MDVFESHVPHCAKCSNGYVTIIYTMYFVGQTESLRRRKSGQSLNQRVRGSSPRWVTNVEISAKIFSEIPSKRRDFPLAHDSEF